MSSGGPQLRAVLLTSSRDWAEATLAAAAASGILVTQAASAEEALRRLVTQHPAHAYLLLDPRDAGSLLDDLIGMTTGEAGSGTRLIQLGEQPSAASLHHALSGEARPAATLPALAFDELLDAVARNMMRARYQPIVRIADCRPVGAEVLARLDHFSRGILPPDQFVPLFEAAGLATQLTAAVVAHTLRDIGRAGRLDPDFRLALNFPLDVILIPEIMARLDLQCAAAGIVPGKIVIELTESRPVEDLPALRAALDRLRQVGYGLAIDDIAPDVTWHPALLDLPFTAIKLDIGVVRGSADDAASAEFLHRTIEAAQSRGLSITAEGIEDTATWNRMRTLGVDNAQGFLIARPLPAPALPVWLDDWKTRQHSLGLRPIRRPAAEC